MKNENIFETADLALAATISTLLVQPISLKRAAEQKVIFVFENSVRLKVIVEKYWSDRLMVSPQRFFIEQKKLKNRLYSFLNY